MASIWSLALFRMWSNQTLTYFTLWVLTVCLVQKEIICDNLDSRLIHDGVCSTYIFSSEGFGLSSGFSTFGATSYIDRFRDLLSLEKESIKRLAYICFSLFCRVFK